MNNRGFTLIELIATLALLSIIAVISFVSITSTLNKSKDNDCKIIVNNIKSAAKSYVSDNRYSLSSKSFDLTASELVSENYLSSPITNPYNGNDITSSIKLKVSLNDDYTVNEITITAPAVLKDCKKS